MEWAEPVDMSTPGQDPSSSEEAGSLITDGRSANGASLEISSILAFSVPGRTPPVGDLRRLQGGQALPSAERAEERKDVVLFIDEREYDIPLLIIAHCSQRKENELLCSWRCCFENMNMSNVTRKLLKPER